MQYRLQVTPFRSETTYFLLITAWIKSDNHIFGCGLLLLSPLTLHLLFIHFLFIYSLWLLIHIFLRVKCLLFLSLHWFILFFISFIVIFFMLSTPVSSTSFSPSLPSLCWHLPVLLLIIGLPVTEVFSVSLCQHRYGKISTQTVIHNVLHVLYNLTWVEYCFNNVQNVNTCTCVWQYDRTRQSKAKHGRCQV